MKHPLLAMGFLVAAVGADAAPETPNAPAGQPARGIGVIREVVPVSFTQPIRLYRHGKPVEARDALALRVRVKYISDFLPMGITPPLFMFGDHVCEMVESPLGTGEALILAPRPPGDERPELWITPAGALPKTLTPEETRQYRKDAATRGYSLPVPLPDRSVRPTLYADLAAFKKAVRRRNPE